MYFLSAAGAMAGSKARPKVLVIPAELQGMQGAVDQRIMEVLVVFHQGRADAREAAAVAPVQDLLVDLLPLRVLLRLPEVDQQPEELRLGLVQPERRRRLLDRIVAQGPLAHDHVKQVPRIGDARILGELAVRVLLVLLLTILERLLQEHPEVVVAVDVRRPGSSSGGSVFATMDGYPFSP